MTAASRTGSTRPDAAPGAACATGRADLLSGKTGQVWAELTAVFEAIAAARTPRSMRDVFEWRLGGKLVDRVRLRLDAEYVEAALARIIHGSSLLLLSSLIGPP